MQRRLGRLLLPVVAIFALALLVACGSSATEPAEPAATSAPQAAATEAPTAMPAQPTSAPSQGQQATSAPTAPPAATEAPPVVSTAAPEGELIIMSPDLGFEVPVGWNETVAGGKAALRLIYDQLVGLDDENNLDADWGLASSWEMEPDGKKWTFFLKRGIPYHNGDEFIADDMTFIINKWLAPESVGSYKERLTAFVESMEAPDPYTWIVNTSTPDIWLHWDLTDAQGALGAPVPSAYYQSVGDEEFASNPIGTGPYSFAEQRIGDFMDLSAVEDHWREGTPTVATIRLRKVPEESTRIAALKTGEADIITVSRENVPEIRDAGLQVFLREGQAIVGFYFHQQWEDVPTSDIRVREAMNLAVNREELAEFIFGGLASPGAVYPVPGSAPVTDPTLQPYGYDPERAKQLLEEAGYGDGFEVTVHSYPRSDVPEGPRMIEALAGYFDEIGVKANILPTEYSKYRTGRRAQTIPGEMGYLGAPNRPFPGFVGLMRALQHSSSPFTSTKDPEFDRLIEAMEGTLDPKEAEEHFLGIYRRYHEQFTHLTLLDIDIPYAANDKVPADWNLAGRSWEPNFNDVVRPR
jgi:peptide/nickel transport system substrate-binding protein